MKVLVLAERPGAAEELCAGARAMGADEVALVAFGDMEMPPSCADLIYRVTVPEGLSLDNATATVNAIFDHVRPDVVLVEPTRHMRILAGALAFHGGTSAIADVMELDGDVASSMYYGGAAILKRKPGKTAIYLMQPGAFGDSVAASGANQEEPFAWVDPGATVKVLSSEPIEKSGVDLQKADVVVAAGRGFGLESDLDMARALCDKLEAGLGCTRPLAEDMKWLPRETYIGVSGLMFAPKVYVAAGLSGQMQHMVGCDRAGTIFAINKDADAAVFDQCDYGIVGDIQTVLPLLVNEL